ncbi:antistasin-like [Gordionus sp. m RMFG-2023]|uniref:antistasin-like n=1 Tax=Gordionus sp. m RMFG-2023 TaxID=3053472 RepID=UPI0031FBD000
MKTLVLIFLTAVNLIVSANGATLEKRDNGMSVMTTKPELPTSLSLYYCQFGNVMDANGCPTCQCKPNPNCPPVCRIYCQFGNVMDANGCPTCKCNPRPRNLASLPNITLQGRPRGLVSNAVTAVDMTALRCPPVCRIYCEFGNVLDVNSCPICQCNPNPNCPPVCRIYCQFGNVMDANGCPTCKCNPRPRNLASLSDTFQDGRSGLDSNAFTAVDTTVRSRCSPVKCLIYCEYGNVVDANGCSTCSCKDYPDSASRAAQPLCPPIMCFVCPYGNVVQKNSNGCLICNCKMYPTTINLD